MLNILFASTQVKGEDITLIEPHFYFKEGRYPTEGVSSDRPGLSKTYYDIDGDGIKDFLFRGYLEEIYHEPVYDRKGNLTQEGYWEYQIQHNADTYSAWSYKWNDEGNIILEMIYKDYAPFYESMVTYPLYNVSLQMSHYRYGKPAIGTYLGNGLAVADISTTYLLPKKDEGWIDVIPSFQNEHTFLADFNGDGLVDRYIKSPTNNKEHSIVYGTFDGEFAPSRMTIVTDTVMAYDWIKPTPVWDGSINIPSLRNGFMIVDGNGAPNTFREVLDINRDGVYDFVNHDNEIFYNIGGNTYFNSAVGAALTPCDLNGDGVLDYVTYNSKDKEISLMLYQSDGSYSVESLMQNQAMSGAFCRDFDHDGDIDILVAIDNPRRTGYGYAVFFRNDGDNSFKKKENAFQGEVKFIGCKDIYNTGTYALIVGRESDIADDNGIFAFEIPADLNVKQEGFRLGGYDSSRFSSDSFLIADVDNDGFMEINGSIKIKTSSPNTRPDRMAAPTAIRKGNKVKVAWAPGSDAQTSSVDLTYELRIGTAPGLCDIMSVPANPDGTRRNLEEGTKGRGLDFLWDVGMLTEGDYYLSIQAVDDGGMGGEWSDYTVYSHRITSFDIQLNADKFSTFRPLEVKTTMPNVVWHTDGESEITADGNGAAKISFRLPGKKKIWAEATIADGSTIQSVVKEVNVLPLGDEDNYPTFASDLGLDINGDGLNEPFTHTAGHTTGWSLGWLMEQPDGDFKQYAKSFNPDLSVAYGVVDANMDGAPDFIASKQNGDIGVFINDWEGDFEFKPLDGNLNISESIWTDLNNDGLFDIVPGFYLNEGNSFTEARVPDDFVITYVYDYNSDGLLDLIGFSYERVAFLLEYVDDGVYVFIKEPGTELYYADPVKIFDKKIKYNFRCADLNNDGFMDILFESPDKKNTLCIAEGSASNPFTNIVEIPVLGDGDYGLGGLNVFTPLRDFDNNGYLDIIAGNQVLYMGKGYSVTQEEEFYHSPLPFTRHRRNEEIPYLSPSLHSGIANEAPSMPQDIAIQQTDSSIIAVWSPSTDKETPSVALEYIVSVKKKGASGDGAYILSPLNYGSDLAAIPSNHQFTQATQIILPLSIFEAGQAYEMRVQAIDLWQKHSPTSVPVEFTIEASAAIEMDSEGALNEEIVIVNRGTENNDWDVDGGTITKTEGNKITVKWSVPGVKTVSLGNSRAQILIHDITDVSFDIPSSILAAAPVRIAVPQALLDMTNAGGIRASGNGWSVDISNKDFTDDYISLTFPAIGSYTVEAYCTNPYSATTYAKDVEITEVMPNAEILSVDGNGAVRWDSNGLPSSITQVEVLKESSRADEFNSIAMLDVREGEYIDAATAAMFTPQTYAIRFVASNGQKSEPSVAHTTVHLMILNSIDGNYNLVWTPYSGRKVESYIIKQSKDGNVSTLDQISGNNHSYTLRNADAEAEYFVDIIFAEPQRIRRNASESYAAESNEISSNGVRIKDAITPTLPTSMKIMSFEKEAVINSNQPQVHLFAELLPTNATINRVHWTIVSGQDIATVNYYGVVSAVPGMKGEVVVRAETIDGSDLYDEITISVSDITDGIDELPLELDTQLTFTHSGNVIAISGWNQGSNAVAYIVTLDGRVADIMRTTGDEILIDTTRYDRGFYVIKCVYPSENSRVVRLLERCELCKKKYCYVQPQRK